MITFISSLVDPEERAYAVGFIPQFLDESDPRPAREQLDANYAHGGGWRPWDVNNIQLDPVDKTIRFIGAFTGDPPLHPVASGLFREELILIYEASVILIQQPDGSFEVSRMD